MMAKPRAKRITHSTYYEAYIDRYFKHLSEGKKQAKLRIVEREKQDKIIKFEERIG